MSGYTARRIDNQRKCSSCKELLILSNTTPEATESLPQEHQKLFEMTNRGGLVEPSAFCFATTILATQFFNALLSNEENMKRLLALSNPRAVFTNTSAVVARASTSCDLTEIKCSSDHTNFKLIVRTVFNCFAKNQLKKLNCRPSLDPPGKSLQKIRKLTFKASNS